MGFLEPTIIVVSSSPFLYFLLFLLNRLHKIWWTPISIKHTTRSQGIGGPPYKFLCGNDKEILKMRIESMSRPMDLSHNVFPRILPRQHSWLNTYGNSFLFWHGSRAQLVITESKLVKEIFNNKEKAYWKTETEGYLKKLFGDDLLTSEGEKWAKQRKLANHAFHAQSLKNMIPAMIVSVEMMLERWKLHEGKEIE
ncbi:cytochrome P450 CYP749A22-like isoform X2 [Actinidia eriantha]|nr:cytochrome P450 CYP749A22-like isoform X2 [Actinidia eriantha]